VKAVSFTKKHNSTLVERWFDGSVKFNQGLIAVIGNKGSGKSALAIR